MSLAVVAGATIACTMAVPGNTSSLVSTSTILIDNKPALTIKDNAFGANVIPFPLCQAPANPAVQAATAAAMGVPTPSACMGNFIGPWLPEQVDKILGSSPCLTQGCTLQCAWGGTIQILNPGQTKTIL